MKFTVANTIALICTIAVSPVPAICLKLASEGWVVDTPWFPLDEFFEVNGRPAIYFIVALFVGIVPPVCVTIALRGNKPNIVFATFGAPTKIVMHLTLAVYFANTLTPLQWLGIAIIVFGVILLRTSKPDAVDAAAEAIVHELEEASQHGAGDDQHGAGDDTDYAG